MVAKEDIIALAVAVAVPMFGGFAGSLTTMPEVLLKGSWYSKLKKPRWTPPNWLFGPAWSVLYVAQGVASFLVWRHRGTKNVVPPLALYGAQLLLNFIWTPLFFGAHRPDVATVEATAVLGLATAATVSMARTASVVEVVPLMAPYLAWMAFATALAGSIHKKNPKAHEIVSSTSGPGKDLAGRAKEVEKQGKEAASQAKDTVKDASKNVEKTGKDVAKNVEKAGTAAKDKTNAAVDKASKA